MQTRWNLILDVRAANGANLFRKVFLDLEEVNIFLHSGETLRYSIQGRTGIHFTELRSLRSGRTHA